jgi:hypothetical protein
MGAGAEPGEIAALFSVDVEFEIAGDIGALPWIGRKSGRSAAFDFIRDTRRLIERIRSDVASAINPRASARPSYAQVKPLVASGSARIRCPVTAKIALQTAGSTGGRAGSPRPVGGLSVFRKYTSICGACRKRSKVC